MTGHAAAVLPRVEVDRWLTVLYEEYLSDYVPAGGSAVKFVAADPDGCTRVRTEVCELARRCGMFVVDLDASRLEADGTRPDLHRIDHFFSALMKEVDLPAWAAAQAGMYLQRHGLHRPEGAALDDVDAIASVNGRDPADLINQYQRDLGMDLLKDPGMAAPFRTAVTELVRAQLIPSMLTPTTQEVLLAWFVKANVPGAAAALRRVRIFERIVQSNARAMLASLCHWVPQTGRAGTVVVLDTRAYEHRPMTGAQRDAQCAQMARVALNRGVSMEEMARILTPEDAPALTYGDKPYMHMLATLRRFVDEIDTFERFLLVVLTTPAFYNLDSPRNYHNYDALQTRIGLEVRDAHRANPAASLVFV